MGYQKVIQEVEGYKYSNNQTYKKISNYLFDYADILEYKTITSICNELYVSNTQLDRFAKKCGFTNFTFVRHAFIFNSQANREDLNYINYNFIDAIIVLDEFISKIDDCDNIVLFCNSQPKDYYLKIYKILKNIKKEVIFCDKGYELKDEISLSKNTIYLAIFYDSISGIDLSFIDQVNNDFYGFTIVDNKDIALEYKNFLYLPREIYDQIMVEASLIKYISKSLNNLIVKSKE